MMEIRDLMISSRFRFSSSGLSYLTDIQSALIRPFMSFLRRIPMFLADFGRLWCASGPMYCKVNQLLFFEIIGISEQ